MKRLLALVGTAVVVIALGGCEEEKYIHVGPNWAALSELKQPEDGFRVTVEGKKRSKQGETLSFQVVSEKPGRLWVAQVDPEDRVTLLFPNERSHDNTVAAKKPFRIPPQGAGWQVVAGEPLGKSVVAFIVTGGDTDLRDVLGSRKDMTKALRLVERAPFWGMGKLVIDVKE